MQQKGDWFLWGEKVFTADRTTIRRSTNALVIIATTLVTAGVVFVYSSSSVFALEKFGSSEYFIKKQLIGLVLGVLGFLVCRLIPVDLLRTLSPILFLSSLGFTALTMLPSFAMRVHGSSRWLNIFGFSFQPSELLKFAFVLYIAHVLAKRERSNSSFLSLYIHVGIVAAVTALLLLKQPDFGLAVTLFVTAFSLLFTHRFNARYALFTVISLITAATGLVAFRAYRIKRIMTFLNPWKASKGAGFQIIQSLIAIGSGGVTGVGISHSKQKFFYLPMQHTDFIFSIIAEETGFLGCAFLVMLYLLFLYFGIRVAWYLEKTFSVLTTLGFTFLITLQAATNMLVVTGLLPTKGVGLPFISYGNSSLIFTLCMLGVIINCGREETR